MRRLVAVFTASVLLAGACAGERGPQFDGQQAMALAARQMEFGPRVIGSAAHAATRAWIVSTLEAHGWQTEVSTADVRGTRLYNLVGRRGDSAHGPILLGAHYDSRAVADRDPLGSEAAVPGANDGASGVAVLLELARVLPGRLSGQEIWLVFFDGEDAGGLDGWEWAAGAAAFAAGLTEMPQAVVIVDMVGDADLRLPVEAQSDPRLAEEIWAVADDQGAPAFVREAGPSILDDHRPFLDRGIPAVDIIDIDYAYYHTTSDTLDKISAASLEQVGQVLEAWVLARR